MEDIKDLQGEVSTSSVTAYVTSTSIGPLAYQGTITASAEL